MRSLRWETCAYFSPEKPLSLIAQARLRSVSVALSPPARKDKNFRRKKPIGRRGKGGRHFLTQEIQKGGTPYWVVVPIIKWCFVFIRIVETNVNGYCSAFFGFDFCVLCSFFLFFSFSLLEKITLLRVYTCVFRPCSALRIWSVRIWGENVSINEHLDRIGCMQNTCTHTLRAA